MEESSYPRVTRFETGKPGKVESISHSLKEESDVHLRQTWSQSALQEEPNLEEKSNFQLVDRILAQYGAHLGRQTGSKQYMEMAEYLSRYSEQQYASSGYKDRQMLAPTSRTTFRDRSGHTSFEQDPDCFPKAYVPIAHSIDDHQESQFNSSVKVRDVLKKAIRSGVKGSGQKSIANSSNSFIEQGSLFDRQRVKEILIQQKAINLYHRDISQDNRSMVSRNKSEERYQKDSDYGFDSSHYDEVSEKFSEDEASRQAATADSRHGVPVFTYLGSGPQSEKKPSRKEGPIVGAFHGYSDQIFKTTAPKTNSFFAKNLCIGKGADFSTEDDREGLLRSQERQSAYQSNQSVHQKRVTVVRAKCPPTSNKTGYSRLYDMRSQDYVSNPYGGPSHVQARLKLINNQ